METTNGQTARRDLPRYDAYRDSGVDWLGEVPAHWEVKPVRRTFRIYNGTTPKATEADYWDGDILWVTPDDLGKLRADTVNETGRQVTKEGFNSCGLSLAPAGSLILSTRAPIGHVAIAGQPASNNQGCKSLAFADEGDSRFYYYQLLAAKQDLQSWGQGATFTELSSGKLAAVPLAVPPLEEQRAITAFLDRETARLDALVAKKERHIELLQEHRQALITRTVTRGLDPNVSTKDSGVDWLGAVPTHWEVKPVRRTFRIYNGTTPKATEADYWDGDILWVTPDDLGKLRADTVNETGRQVTKEGFNSCGLSLAPAGSLILSTRAPIGHVAIAGQPASNNQGCKSLAFADEGDSRFYYYQLLAAKQDLQSWGQGATFTELSSGKLAAVPLAVPPPTEQRAIAAFLDRETVRIDGLMRKVRETIGLLREYRAALIAAAVTGRIDVREAAPTPEPATA